MNLCRSKVVFLLTFVFLSHFEHIEVDSSCETGWANHLNYCYFFEENTQSWQNAKQGCWNKQALLVTIFRQTEQSFIDPHITTGDYWIGLHGNTGTDIFTWVHGKTATLFKDISDSDSSSGVDACVYIDSAGEWRAASCSSTKKFICKRPECSDGLRLNVNVAAGGDCLIFRSGAFSWQEARAQCQSLDGDTDLASPTNNEFKNFLQNNYANHANMQNFWLGMQYSSGGVSLLSGQTTDWTVNDRDGQGGECIAWLNQNDHGEIHACSNQLHALCQRSVYYYEEEAPTTKAPTTNAPTTESVTTTIPTTEAQTTESLTTTVPTTKPLTVPTTESITTAFATTKSLTTPVSTTKVPTTKSATTAAPTTEAPSTNPPTTSSLTTTISPTQSPTTAAPSTAAPTTAAATTASPTTDPPTTAGTTTGPTTNPTTPAATTADPTTDPPTTAAAGTTAGATTDPPTTAGPTAAPTTDPSTAAAGTTADPITNPPSTASAGSTTVGVMTTHQPTTKTHEKLASLHSAMSDPDATDEDIQETEEWLLDHPTIPNDVTDHEDYVTTYLSVCSDMINNERSSYWKSDEKKSGGASEVAIACSSLVDDFAKGSDTDTTIVTPNIVATTKAFSEASSFEDITVAPTSSSSVVITKEDFDKLGIDDNKKISVSITTYQHGELITGRSGDTDESAPVSGVVAITVYGDGIKISMPVSFTLTVDQAEVDQADDGETPTCVYQKTENGEKTWDTEGCESTKTENTTVECSCNHTTNFAILMQVKDVKISKKDELALDWITYICCSLSIVALLLTLIVLLSLRSLLRSERVLIHVNLVVALILAQTLLLLSTPAAATESVCRAVAIMMHYFFTAVFCWMLVEGVHLYLQIVRVFSAGKDRFIPYMLVGWGTPILIVGLTAGIRWYGYGDNGRCWLSTAYGMVWAFVAPALVIIAVNFVILIMVLRILVVSAKSKSEGDFDHIKAGLKGAVLLLPLLGVTWLFGIISVSAHTVVFLYLFSFFNSLQGVFIFLMYCVFNAEVRNAVNRQKEKRALTRGDMVSTMDSMSDSKNKSKANRVHPEGGTKDTEMLDIKSTTTTTTHTQMVIRRQPGSPGELKKPASIADVD